MEHASCNFSGEGAYFGEWVFSMQGRGRGEGGGGASSGIFYILLLSNSGLA